MNKKLLYRRFSFLFVLILMFCLFLTGCQDKVDANLKKENTTEKTTESETNEENLKNVETKDEEDIDINLEVDGSEDENSIFAPIKVKDETPLNNKENLSKNTLKDNITEYAYDSYSYHYSFRMGEKNDEFLGFEVENKTLSSPNEFTCTIGDNSSKGKIYQIGTEDGWIATWTLNDVQYALYSTEKIELNIFADEVLYISNRIEAKLN